MEPTIPEQSMQVFMYLFASGVVFATILHYLIVALSIWKSFLKP